LLCEREPFDDTSTPPTREFVIMRKEPGRVCRTGRVVIWVCQDLPKQRVVVNISLPRNAKFPGSVSRAGLKKLTSLE
jgi:hypothetical protein